MRSQGWCPCGFWAWTRTTDRSSSTGICRHGANGSRSNSREDVRTWLNLYLPSVKLLKKIHVGSKLRRVYDGPKTPLERVVASKQGDAAQISILKELQRSLDPFQLAKVIDRKLERIYRLANRRLSPQAQEKLASSQAQSSRRKDCGKAARFASLEIPSGFPLSHSHNNNKRAPVTYQMARRGSLGLHF